jgi:hypothetical protein
MASTLQEIGTNILTRKERTGMHRYAASNCSYIKQLETTMEMSMS